MLLVTTGVLAALALYADALGPAGHWFRHGAGAVLGWSRELLPVVLIGAGVLLIVGRRDPDSEDGRRRREPVRAVIGGVLVLLSVSGLAAIAGGSPALGASVGQLSDAGGWLGAVVGDPLHSAIGGLGEAVVFVAVLVLALVLATGVTLLTASRRAGAGCACWRRRPGDGADPPVEAPGEDTPPFGTARQPAAPLPVTDAGVDDPITDGGDDAAPPAGEAEDAGGDAPAADHPDGPPEAAGHPVAATRGAHGDRSRCASVPR